MRCYYASSPTNDQEFFDALQEGARAQVVLAFETDQRHLRERLAALLRDLVEHTTTTISAGTFQVGSGGTTSQGGGTTDNPN